MENENSGVVLRRDQVSYIEMTILEHKKLLHQVHLPEIARSELVKDVNKINNIIKSAKGK